MAISDRDRKLLWGGSGDRCAFRDPSGHCCRRRLTQDKEGGDQAFPLGVEAHIVGEKLDAPRGRHPLPVKERNTYDNLILLDPTHHRVIDEDVETYTVEALKKMKADHERWVDETLGPTFPPTVSLSKLPVPLSPELFGREKELALLDHAWADPNIRVLAFIAFGGVGKSALVHHWLNQFLCRAGVPTPAASGEAGPSRVQPPSPLPRRVFGWSFYSQGTTDRTVSSDLFIHTALTWFGDPNPNEGSPWDKGVRLAHLIKQQPTLLILDGLEPLQWGPGPQHGEFKDRAGSMLALLRELSYGMDGLCVISSRVDVADLAASGVLWEPRPRGDAPVLRANLDRLSAEAGRALLRHYNTKGLDSELDAAVEEYGGHALALCLLAEYLVEFLDGDVARRDQVPLLDQETRLGKHAFRVMEAYDIALKRDGREPERAILRTIGLFDRPASKDCLDALRRAPAISGVTDFIVDQPEKEWGRAVSRLRRWGLLAHPPGEDDGSLDAHPLVREWFAETLGKERPEGSRKAHGRLYEHLRDHGKPTPDTDTDTLEDVMPLFQAVHHGCRAGRHEEASSCVFAPRLHRRNDNFVVHKLGGVGSQLAALAGFFPLAWTRPVSGLSARSKVFLLNEVGYDLWTTGRLGEATPPIEEALELDLEDGNLKSGAWTARTLMRVHLAAGRLATASEVARRAVDLAERSRDSFERLVNRSYQGAVLHRQGCLSHAHAAFRNAECILTTTSLPREGAHHVPPSEWSRSEQILRSGDTSCPYLWGVPAAHYSDLLLEMGLPCAVLQRSAETAAMTSAVNRLLDFGLDQLNRGRALYHLAVRVAGTAHGRADPDSEDEALPLLSAAVSTFQRSARQDDLAQSLLARASFLRDFGPREDAYRDLREALDLSARIGLRLHETDAHLLEGHMALVEDPPQIETAQAALSRAQELVKETGYHLRDADLLILEGRLLAKEGDKAGAGAKLHEAIKVAKREEADGAVYQVAVDQAERYLKETES